MKINNIALGVSLAVLVLFSACAAELTGPSPSADSVAPALACNVQLVTEVTLSGAELSPLALDAATGDPRLAIPDIDLRLVTDLSGGVLDGSPIRLPNDPDDPMAARVSWESSTTMRFEVYPELGLEPGLYEVTVTNRNGKSATLETRLTMIPEPVLSVIAPDLVCNEEGDRTLTLTGASFAQVDGVLPNVQIGTEALVAASAEDCSEVPGAAMPLSLCNTLTVVLPQGAEDPGVLNVHVTNPTPAACESEVVTIATVPEPTVASVVPDLFCTADGTVSLTITGTGFIDVGGVLPTVLFDAIEVQATAVAGCDAIAGTLLTATSCTSLTVEVATGAVPDGVHGVFVRNPSPAACTSNENVTVLIAGAPVVDTVAPEAICALDLPSSVVVTGSGLLRVDDGAGGFTEPQVVLDDGTSSFLAPVSAMGGCVALVGTSTVGESCTSLTFNLADTVAADSYELTLINPSPANCSLSAPITFDVANAPSIASIAPNPVCGAGDTLTVTGTGFTAASEILVDGGAVPTTFVSATELTGTIVGIFPAGSYDVTVSNQGTCVSVAFVDQLVVPGIPIVFFVDPPNNFSGIDTRLRVWVSGINGTTPTVAIRLTGTTDVPTPLVVPVFNGSNQVLVTLPAGQEAGDYDVLVQDTPCPAQIINALHITDTPTVHISELTPGFGADDANTGIIIRSDDPTPAGDVNFVATPRAYLTPQAGGVAAEIKSVSFESASKLTGVVPLGLAPGSYDLIVVNPDGQVGVLADAFRVLPAADPPPIVDNLLPSQANDGSAVLVSVLGSFFPTNLADISVTAECLDPANGATQSRTASVLASAFGQIDTQWDLSGLAGFVCLVRVDNLNNLTFTEFSALAVTNSSGNLNNFTLSSNMVEARRALGGATIRQNGQSRFIFAIGGDGGDNGVDDPIAFASVESAPVDAFGDVGVFSLQRNSLPEPRSFAGFASIGRFVYGIGGRLNSGAAGPGTVTDSVLRAFLLDPEEAPILDDISLDQAAATGLPGGIFYYRVAAVMAASDPNNPSGEGLPSQPFVVQLPVLTGGVNATISWTSVPGAASYRVYRSPVPGLALGSEVFLASEPHVVGPARHSFLDDNSIDNSAETATPLPLGSLGVWNQVATLNTAREGAAVVAVPDPVNTDIYYLYAFGGLDGAGAELGGYEYVAVTDIAGNDQPVAAPTFTTGVQTLNNPRWLAGAVYLDLTRTPDVEANSVWVYVLKGSTAALTNVNRLSLYQVDTAGGGELINEQDLNAGGNFGGGYGQFAGNDSIFVFGGGGAPATTGRSGLLDTGPCPGATCFPALANLNAGFSLAIARFLHASTTEGAFIYLLGGQTDTLDATSSIERTNL